MKNKIIDFFKVIKEKISFRRKQYKFTSSPILFLSMKHDTTRNSIVLLN